MQDVVTLLPIFVVPFSTVLLILVPFPSEQFQLVLVQAFDVLRPFAPKQRVVLLQVEPDAGVLLILSVVFQLEQGLHLRFFFALQLGLELVLVARVLSFLRAFVFPAQLRE